MGVAYMQVNSNYRQNIISYENKQKSNGTPTFAQYVTEKNEERLRDEAATDFEERVLQSAGPNAPQSVKDAWMETTKEIGFTVIRKYSQQHIINADKQGAYR